MNSYFQFIILLLAGSILSSCHIFNNNINTLINYCGEDVDRDKAYIKIESNKVPTDAFVSWVVNGLATSQKTHKSCLAVSETDRPIAVRAQVSSNGKIYGVAAKVTLNPGQLLTWDIQEVKDPNSILWRECGIVDAEKLSTDSKFLKFRERSANILQGDNSISILKNGEYFTEILSSECFEINATSNFSWEFSLNRDKELFFGIQANKISKFSQILEISFCQYGESFDLESQSCVEDQVKVSTSELFLRQSEEIKDFDLFLLSARSKGFSFDIEQTECPFFSIVGNRLQGSLPGTYLKEKCEITINGRFQNGETIKKSITIKKVAHPSFLPLDSSVWSWSAGEVITPISLARNEESTLRFEADLKPQCGWMTKLIKGSLLSGVIPPGISEEECTLRAIAQDGETQTLKEITIKIKSNPEIDCPLKMESIPNYTFDWTPYNFIHSSTLTTPVVGKINNLYTVAVRKLSSLDLLIRKDGQWKLHSQILDKNIIPISILESDQTILRVFNLDSGRVQEYFLSDNIWKLSRQSKHTFIRAPVEVRSFEQSFFLSYFDSKIIQLSESELWNGGAGTFLLELPNLAGFEALVANDSTHIIARVENQAIHVLLKNNKVFSKSKVSDCNLATANLFRNRNGEISLLVPRPGAISNFIYRVEKWFELDSRAFSYNQSPKVIWHAETSDLIERNKKSEEPAENPVIFVPLDEGIVQLGRLGNPMNSAQIIRNDQLKLIKKCSDSSSIFATTFDDFGNCTDGSAILFNGLLCASGETLGCEAVKSSIDIEGEVWRSPRKIGGQNFDKSISRPLLPGLLLYFSSVIDSDNSTLLESVLKSITAYKITSPDVTCSSSNISQGICEFRITKVPQKSCKECAINEITWLLLKALVERYQSKGLLPTPLPFSEDIKNELEKANLENLSTLLEGYLDEVVIQKKSEWHYHYIATIIFFMQKIKLNTKYWTIPLKKLVASRPNNPFFQFLKDPLDPTIAIRTDKLCRVLPGEVFRDNFRTWIWELSEIRMNSSQSMGWDCIFMSNLMRSNEKPLLTWKEAFRKQANYYCNRQANLFNQNQDSPISVKLESQNEKLLGVIRAELLRSHSDSYDLIDVALFIQKVDLEMKAENFPSLAKYLHQIRFGTEPNAEEVARLVAIFESTKLDETRNRSIPSWFEPAIEFLLKKTNFSQYRFSEPIPSSPNSLTTCETELLLIFEKVFSEEFWYWQAPSLG